MFSFLLIFRALDSLLGCDFVELNSSEQFLDMFSKSPIVKNTGVFCTPALHADEPPECNKVGPSDICASTATARSRRSGS